jgi:hypothetical protein
MDFHGNASSWVLCIQTPFWGRILLEKARGTLRLYKPYDTPIKTRKGNADQTNLDSLSSDFYKEAPFLE